MMDFKIVGIENAFTEPRPLFNPNGDKSMIRIHRITKFD
jgi:hypothetical protein